MGIRATMRPTAPYDRAEAAINELNQDDREELMDVLFNDPTYTRQTIADYLNQMTSNKYEVTKSSVTNYYNKVNATKANA